MVQASPWELGRTFGGKAESRWVTFHPEECQVLDDGRRVAGACLNSPAYRAFCKEWADWALECGVDSVFWDEPAWMVPAHVGIDDPTRWTCRWAHCAERFAGPVPGAEVGPTFGSARGEVVAIVAGDSEDAEDDVERGGADMRALAIGPKDAVVVVSASGVIPYTLAALEAARAAGALCVAIVCTPDSVIASVAEHELRVLVGPEVVSGSTRLKAGTAQKLVLNAISTATMIRLGRTYDGLMVGVAPENAKLRERGRRNVVIASGRSEADVDEALTAAEGDARVALVALLAGVDPATALERLAGAGGSVSVALGGRP